MFSPSPTMPDSVQSSPRTWVSSTNSFGDDKKKQPIESASPMVTSVKSKRRATTIRSVEDGIWAVLPLLFHVSGLGLLIAAFVQHSLPYLHVTQDSGSGQLIYGVLDACWKAPDASDWSCTSRSLNANFVPALVGVNEWMVAPATLQLPLRSSQTPAITLTAIILSLLSLIVYLPVWIMAYFPSTRMPGRVRELILDHSRQFFFVAGMLSFASFMISITIGIGYKLLMRSAALYFHRAQTSAFLAGWTGSSTSVWTARTGRGFDLFWAGSVMQALVALGTNVALHNRLDERIERNADDGPSMTTPYW